MGDIGVKFIKEGSGDALTAADKDLQLTTKNHNLMVFAKGVFGSTSGSIAHNLGFIPGYAAYIKDGTKHFLTYYQNAGSGISFETPATGTISSDVNNINLTASAADRLVYLIFANPIFESFGNNFAPVSPIGMRFAETPPFELGDGIGIEYVNTDYQLPMIVQKLSGTVSLPSLSVAADQTKYQTAFVDIAHSLGQAVHVISPDLHSFSVLALYPAPIGVVGPHEEKYIECYIDESKIRLRMSRIGYGESTGGPTTVYAATSFSANFFVTNILLP